MLYSGYAVWCEEDLLSLFASCATSREEAIRQFTAWQTRFRGYKPWQTWLAHGYRVVRVNLEISEEDIPS